MFRSFVLLFPLSSLFLSVERLKCCWNLLKYATKNIVGLAFLYWPILFSFSISCISRLSFLSLRYFLPDLSENLKKSGTRLMWKGAWIFKKKRQTTVWKSNPIHGNNFQNGMWNLPIDWKLLRVWAHNMISETRITCIGIGADLALVMICCIIRFRPLHRQNQLWNVESTSKNPLKTHTNH